MVIVFLNDSPAGSPQTVRTMAPSARSLADTVSARERRYSRAVSGSVTSAGVSQRISISFIRRRNGNNLTFVYAVGIFPDLQAVGF